MPSLLLIQRSMIAFCSLRNFAKMLFRIFSFKQLCTSVCKFIICYKIINRLQLCAAEAVFCYTAENSHHLKAQVTSKNPQFQEEKISERRKVRSQVTLEKSSKNYITLFGGKPARGLLTPKGGHKIVISLTVTFNR